MSTSADKSGQDSGQPRADRAASCHPDRHVHAKGLCQPCYRAQLRSSKKAQAGCHPEEPHYAKGLCSRCYFHEHRQNGKVQPFVPGLSRDQVPILLRGACGICRRTDAELSPDRDQRTGRLRGVLCDRCRDLVSNETLIQLAADYLKPWARSQSA